MNKRMKHNDNIAGLLFVAPAVIGLIIFTMIPLLFSLLLSFTEWNFLSGFDGIEFVGLKNFFGFSKDIWFQQAVKNSILFALTTVPIGLAISLTGAVLINKYIYMGGLFKILVFIPYISSIVASAIVWNVLLHPSYGPVNMFLASIGVTDLPKWFQDSFWAMPALIAFSIWQQMGYYIIVYLAGIKNIPNELYEASDIDGASAWSKFRYVTIPMVSPTTFFLFVLGMINAFKVFDHVMVLTEGGPGSSSMIMALYVYRKAFENYEMGPASAAAWIMFVFIFAITLFQWKAQEKWVNY